MRPQLVAYDLSRDPVLDRLLDELSLAAYGRVRLQSAGVVGASSFHDRSVRSVVGLHQLQIALPDFPLHPLDGPEVLWRVWQSAHPMRVRPQSGSQFAASHVPRIALGESSRARFWLASS